MIVTEHAIDRYIERIEPIGRSEAHASIAAAENAIELAASLGAHIVKTAKAKLILQGTRVVSVIPKSWIDHSDLTMAQRAQRFAEHRAAWS